MEHRSLTIGHLFPDLLNLYGDRGNILTLQNRLLWRGFGVETVTFEKDTPLSFEGLDLVFLGGGSDREQLLVCQQLHRYREELAKFVESGGVLVAVCSGYQLLGRTFQSHGEIIEGLSLLDIYTEEGENRFIGNVVITTEIMGTPLQIVGFENHSGRTYIGNHAPFGQVISGSGNNGADGTCGVVYKNVLGTYLHGPLLPKNPQLADYLLQQAFMRKYGEPVGLISLHDRAEQEAHAYALNRFLHQS
ncbi:MAG: glutamine amidotransferase [Ruminococcaceae bacterium]|nr:glutamine amidotransferase [Oscillospiraceae bacterium]